MSRELLERGLCVLRRVVFGFVVDLPRLVDSLRWNRFELALLAIPLTRGVFYPFGFVPAQFDESDVIPFVRVTVLTLLGFGAGIVYLGILARKSLIESIGLTIVWPLCVAYVIVLLAANWHDSLITCIVYLVIAVVCRDREREIGPQRALAARWHAEKDEQA